MGILISVGNANQKYVQGSMGMWCIEKYLEYFFTYWDDIPEGIGFSMFGWEHILWLLFVLSGLLFCLKCIRVCDRHTAGTWIRCIGSFLLFLIIFRIALIVFLGKMSVYELPLHLCSMAGILCFIHAWWNIKWVGQVLYTLCLPGTVFALIFPNWTEYPAIHWITIQSFLFHGGIVLYVVSQLKIGMIKPEFRYIRQSLLFLLVTVPVIYIFDWYFHVNFMFVRIPSSDSPLAWMARYMGVPGYLWGYALLVICVMVCMNGGYELYDRLQRKKDKSNERQE